MQALTKEQQRLVAEHKDFAETLAQKLGQRVASDLPELCIDMDDLKQESLLGLCEAALHYDAKAGASFKTMAYFWCRRYVLLAIRKYGVPVSVPNNFTEPVHTVRLDWMGDGGDDDDETGSLRLPTMEGGDAVAVNGARGLIDELSLRADREATLQEAYRELAEQWLSQLTLRDQTVIRLVFGLDCTPLHYRSVARQVGISCTRVNQIVKLAGGDGGGRLGCDGRGGARGAGRGGRLEAPPARLLLARMVRRRGA